MNRKKLVVSICIVILIFLNFTSPVHASIFSNDDKDKTIEDTIEKDDGGLFEKVIAKMIGGVAETVFDITTNEKFGVRIQKL